MPDSFDVIIIGLGAVGSAAAFHLAKRGCRVLGIDQFTPPHSLGSSHGRSRIIREAYFEHPAYVPLVQRAYVLWQELEILTGKSLLQMTGGLMIGRRDGVVVEGSLRSAQEHHLACELLDHAEVNRRFPALHLPETMCAVWEPRAGILNPEVAVSAHLEAARQHGAQILFDTPVIGWESAEKLCRVQTRTESLIAERLLFTAGSWTISLLPELHLPLAVERQVQFWFTPKRARIFQPEQLPIYIIEYERGHYFYGFPDCGAGVKTAIHHKGEITTPGSVNRTATAGDEENMRALVQTYLPEANGTLLDTAACLYTNTPDENFLISKHPTNDRVVVASACSGHGFKFSSVTGEILADLVTLGKSRFDLDLFKLRWG